MFKWHLVDTQAHVQGQDVVIIKTYIRKWFWQS